MHRGLRMQSVRFLVVNNHILLVSVASIRNDYQNVQISTNESSGSSLPSSSSTIPASRTLPEFDFESANSAFEEIEEKMKNVHVSGKLFPHFRGSLKQQFCMDSFPCKRK